MTSDETPMTPMEVVRAVYDSHERRDTPTLVQLLDPDVEWHQAEGHPYAGNGPWHGPAEVVEHVADPINTEWDGFLTYVDEYLDCGETVIVLGRYRGRYKRTGRRVDAPVCTIYTVRNGRITQWRQFTDTAQIRAAMDLPYPESNVAP